MNELERDYAGRHADLAGIVAKLESALADIDRLEIIVVGAQLSQVIEGIRSLSED